MSDIENKSFVDFIKEYNIIATIIGAVVSERRWDLSNSIINDFIVPIFNRDADGDGKADIKKFEEYKFEISGIKFGVGNFAVVVMKFIIMTVLIFGICKLFKINK